MARNPIFDIMKGIAILLIMSSHLFPHWGSTIFGRAADSFAVPLFFIIGGCLYKDRPFKTALFKDFRRLVIPYILTAISLCLWYLFLYIIRRGDLELLLLKKTALSALWGSSPGGPGMLNDLGVGPTWFLLSLFWCRQLFHQIAKTGKKYCFPLSLVISIASTIFAQRLFYLPWGILQGFSAIVFYAMGWYWRNGDIPKGVVIFAVFCWPIAVWMSSIAMNAAHYKYYFLSVLGGLGGTYCIYFLSSQLAKIPLLLRGLTCCGCNSLDFLCIHDFELNSNIVRTLEIHTVPLTNPISIALSFLFVFAGTIALNVLRRIRSSKKSIQ